MKKYRIVTDLYGGYEVQFKVWYLPFWRQLNFSNTHSSIADAEKYINEDIRISTFKSKVVKEITPTL